MPSIPRSHALTLLVAGLLSWATPTQAAAPPRSLVVAEVVLKGNRRVPTDTLLAMLKTRPGKLFDVDTVRHDVRTLFEMGQFSNVRADKQDNGGHVVVTLSVSEYNALEKITFQGNRRLGNEALQTAAGLRLGGPLAPAACKAACERIVQRYKEEGWHFATCDLAKGNHPADTEVVFTVNEGPRYRVSSVSFVGNSFASAAVLANRIDTSAAFVIKVGKPRPTEDAAETSKRDAVVLADYYRSFGFHDVKVTPELAFTPDGREVAVTFHVVEGVRYRLGDRPEGEAARGEAVEAKPHVAPSVMRVLNEANERAPARSRVILVGPSGPEQAPLLVDLLKVVREATESWKFR